MRRKRSPAPPATYHEPKTLHPDQWPGYFDGVTREYTRNAPPTFSSISENKNASGAGDDAGQRREQHEDYTDDQD